MELQRTDSTAVSQFHCSIMTKMTSKNTSLLLCRRAYEIPIIREEMFKQALLLETKEAFRV